MKKVYVRNMKTIEPGICRSWVFRRGDIYTANLNPFRGSEQGGTRPVLVLQNNDGNIFCPTLIVAPLSSRIKKRNLPTHVLLKKGRGLIMDSIVELEQIKTIDKTRIKRYIGRVTREQMAQVDEALQKSLGMYIPESVEAP
jgi:mRNA interferase MazF